MTAFGKNDDGQAPSEYRYGATEQLIRIETAMTHYNEWIIGMVINGYGKLLDKNTRALDYGAGLGTLSQIFYAKSGIKPDAFEIDPLHREEMERRGFLAYSRFDDLPTDYDLIFVSNVLEHIEEDVGVLRSLRAKLKEQGTLIIYVPAFQFLWTSADEKVGHMRRYHKAELSQKLEQAGYKIRHIRYCDALGFFLAFLFKFIGNKTGDLPLRSLAFYDKILLPLSRTMDVAVSGLWGKNLFVVAGK